jgi:regulator of protease activity HflC (stomatin/prohibitin superfamily)
MNVTGRDLLAWLALALVAVVLLVGLLAGWKSFSRYQKRADANNNVKVTAIQIRNQIQRVQIAKQKAQIRVQNAIGIRAAQDHIAATLTPAYLQWEAIQAQLAMASSKNTTFVYIPSGANGVPLVATTTGLQVTKP